MRPKVILHVNFVERHSSIFEICRKAAELGCDGIELRRRRSGVDESPQTYLDAIAEATSHFGLDPVIFGSPGANLMSADQSVRDEEIQSLLSFFQDVRKRIPQTLCNLLIGTVHNPDPSASSTNYSLHGSHAAEERHWRQAVEGMKDIGEFGVLHGLRFAFETHMNYLHDTPQKTKELVDRIACPAVGVNLDYGNAVYFPTNPPIGQVISTLGSSLFYVHLKNSTAIGSTRIPTSLRDGDINHREYLEILKANNYSGPICVESPRPGDRETFAWDDITYLKSLIDQINWVNEQPAATNY